MNCSEPNGVVTLGCILSLLATVIYWALVFVGSVAVIVFILSGIKYIMSWGDAKGVEGARRTLSFAILGILLVLFSFLILQTIANITGIACLNPKNPFNPVDPFSTCQ